MSLDLTAIVVDDDKDTVGVFSDYLKLKKISVLGVGYDGKQAVALYKKHKPDVVFLDHRMPEYNGTFALYHIREINPEATVIMITADAALEDDPNIMKLKPTAIIHKPFNITSILETIENIPQLKNQN